MSELTHDPFDTRDRTPSPTPPPDAQVTRLREALREMVLRFDDMAPKDCQPLAFKMAAIEQARQALAAMEGQP